MDNSVATIQCSNLSCQASNSLTNKICHKCRTPIAKRYLLALGDWLKAYRVGELIGDRYLSISANIVLDTKPNLPPQAPEEVPDAYLPYLKLLGYRPHIPQIYGYLPSPDDQLDLEIWFLEYGTVPLDDAGELKYKELFPLLSEVWQQATAIQQLHWLWQIARLWQPMQNKEVANSLLDPSLLRINGSTVQLLELKFDEGKPASLPELAQLWRQWLPQASPQIAPFLQQLCQHLQQKEITRSEQLLALLDRAIEQCARNQKRTYQIYTCTDSGPTRDHNEDACYPSGGELVEIGDREMALAIVCDGIGGQEGGEIASQLAIETLLEEINHLSSDLDEATPQFQTRAIEQAICATNDFISQRNDSENRQERQRMGTTLVMSLTHNHQMYLAHVGDSRIYKISPTSCHQVTVDDDLASREVRLGYLLYRDAVQYPNAGALVQALGMSSSLSLHPTVQRLILDEDCIFLLCSDGLSDFDRIEQFWRSEIAPILTEGRDLVEAGKSLLEIANRRNGHDNVTLALIHCRVQPQMATESPIIFPEIEIPPPPPAIEEETEEPEIEDQTVLVATPDPETTSKTSQRNSSILTPLAIAFGLLLLGGALFWLWQQFRFRDDEIMVPTISSPSPTPLTSPTTPPSAEAQPQPSLREGDIVKASTPIILQADRTSQKAVTKIPEGSILKVLRAENNSTWLQMQVCQTVTNGTPSSSLSGKQGWIGLEAIASSEFQKIPTQEQSCNEKVNSKRQKSSDP
jgi:protein phosphatase